MARVYYVAKNGTDTKDGTQETPFLTISQAASVAMPGDTVIVHEGVYREWVDPKEGGLSDQERITYCAAEGERPIIKGSEEIKNWEKVEGNVWKVKISNTIFGEFNPYNTYVYGDWMVHPAKPTRHLGEVYLNGKAFYEAESLQEVKNPIQRIEGYPPPWKIQPEKILHPEDTIYQWYSQVDLKDTTIWANFQEYDPNKELVEINVRECCFYPRKSGKNYITLAGFEIEQAACPFTPPTADQPGMVGPHWSKGWIIEKNYLHDAKCSAISLGKDEKTGNNMFTRTRKKPGYTYQFEAVCRALQMGWSKETIGSHIIRNNVIYDCGQNGIVGHLGCIFSKIYENEIYNIAIKHEFFGYEIAGIKLHAAIDVAIEHNYIHHTTLGTWLDWEASGTRVSRNLYMENDRDLMIEVTHGPCTIDNNIFASEYNLDNVAEGSAYVHNLFLGMIRRQEVLDRSTPYHFAHTTQMMGTSFVYSGDDRFFQNIFVGGASKYESKKLKYGTADYDACPATYEEYVHQIQEALPGDEDLYVKIKQPVYINNNVYWNHAKAYQKEKSKIVSSMDPNVKWEVDPRKNKVHMNMEIDALIFKMETKILRTQDLQNTRASEASFENFDGTPIIFEKDYAGERRVENALPGPWNTLKEGKNHILIWE